MRPCAMVGKLHIFMSSNCFSGWQWKQHLGRVGGYHMYISCRMARTNVRGPYVHLDLVAQPFIHQHGFEPGVPDVNVDHDNARHLVIEPISLR